MRDVNTGAAHSAQGQKEAKEEMENNPKMAKVFVPKEYVEKIRNIIAAETDSEAVSLAVFYFIAGEGIGHTINEAYKRMYEEKKKGWKNYINYKKAKKIYEEAKEKAVDFLSGDADTATEEAYFLNEFLKNNFF